VASGIGLFDTSVGGEPYILSINIEMR
jgi:hypothetical protein